MTAKSNIGKKSPSAKKNLLLQESPSWIKNLLLQITALVLASVLYALSFPNLLFSEGLPVCAWIAYIPVFWLVSQISLGTSIIWGAIYGFFSYGLFNYWLTAFHPLAGLIVGIVTAGYFALLFPLLKLADTFFPKKGYIIQVFLWILYEYVRTLGFVAYPYGIIGYSQWKILPLIQISSLFGVWGVSALVVFPSAFLAKCLAKCLPVGLAKNMKSGFFRQNILDFLKKEKIPAIIYGILFVGTLIFGIISLEQGKKELETAETRNFALIQHNNDPWLGGLSQYRKNFETLRRLSLDALADNPKPDLVVWSETAFIPRIYWHQTYRDDQASYLLVKELTDFLAAQDVPFLIGNDDARKELTEDGIIDRVDYNAAMLFEKGKIVNQYRKLHLVPFTEHFPYKKQLPWVHAALLAADTHFWLKGKEYTVFDINGMKFSTPICFEDTFGYLSRNFVKEGADYIVNITNDAWSHSLPAQMQHFSMTVFRAVENRRSLVRATASGQSCGIDPYGRIIAMSEPFEENYLTVTVPKGSGTTLYTRLGEYFAIMCVFLSLGLLVFGGIRAILKRKK
jgi:apolipoprotein N-acyltransferase